MFIRESKTKNKKTGKVYIKHTLVESVRTERGPRQRLVMTLGRLTLDKSLWKELALALELYFHSDAKLEKLSLFALPSELLEEIIKQRTTMKFHKNQRAKEKGAQEEEKDLQQVDINSLAISESRSLGPELVVYDAWKSLRFEQILEDCGFSGKEVALAAAVIWGRLIAPGSDLATWRWLRTSSSLSDFFDVNILKVHKDKIYEIADKLQSKKNILEEKLYKQQCSVLNLQSTLFLFDLTNFYFEGQALGNELAKRGKSKEKRSQNSLVSLALLVDGDGFPIKSEVYEGNIGEPRTLEEILEKSGLLNSPKDELPFRPTLAMDRGIATKENIKLLKKHNFPFTVIQRADKSSKFKDEFKSMNGFTAIKDVKGQTIQLKRIGNELLCVSEGKCLKENAIYNKKKSKIKKELEALSKAFTNGRLQDPIKIQQRIGRIKGGNPGFDKYFSVKFIERKNGKKGELTYQEKTKKNPFAGCYVIEHEDVGNDEETIWRIYSTLTRVEASFRSMKTDLGTRPIYHQGSERTKGHLFISILAYHILANVEYRLRQQNRPSRWSTICKQLSNHTRCIIQWKDEKGKSQNKKLSGQPEPQHLDIYRKLQVTNPLLDFTF